MHPHLSTIELYSPFFTKKEPLEQIKMMGTTMQDEMMVDTEQQEYSASALRKGKMKVVESSPTTTMGDHLPWVEKYRPTHLNDLISHQDIITTSKLIVIKTHSS
jgi:hypothetical protein